NKVTAANKPPIPIQIIYQHLRHSIASHVFHYDETVAQLRRDCDRTVTRNYGKLRRIYA
ncbi:unnamed protein product, partial [Rotaria socialis]